MPPGLAPVDVLKPPLGSQNVLAYELLGRRGHGHVQRREALVGVAPEHGEAAMGTGVGRRQDLGEGVDHGPADLRQRWVGRRGQIFLVLFREQGDLRVDLLRLHLGLELDVDDPAEDLVWHLEHLDLVSEHFLV